MAFSFDIGLMPRVPRIESNEGLYHVINRGNYRARIFETEGAKLAFEKCLFEACERSGWELLGYCLMRNHFHLCIATPRGNLSEGMRWLQSAYAARFNRFRKEKGHLFQGRFKSLIVERGKPLTDLLDYIHLNPVRAGIVEPALVAKYRWSSLHWFPKRKSRPEFMDASWLDYLEGFSDSVSGWRKYALSLRMRASEDPKEIEALEKRMCRGWCIGDQAFKKANAKEFFAAKETLRLEKEALNALNETRWETALEECLSALGETEESARRAAKSAPWKLAIATKLRAEMGARNGWLAERLNMGSARALSSNCSVFRKRKDAGGFASRLKNLTF